MSDVYDIGSILYRIGGKRSMKCQISCPQDRWEISFFGLCISIGSVVGCAGSPTELFDEARAVLFLYSTSLQIYHTWCFIIVMRIPALVSHNYQQHCVMS